MKIEYSTNFIIAAISRPPGRLVSRDDDDGVRWAFGFYE
jgi:hypothetical protein